MHRAQQIAYHMECQLFRGWVHRTAGQDEAGLRVAQWKRLCQTRSPVSMRRYEFSLDRAGNRTRLTFIGCQLVEDQLVSGLFERQSSPP